jgi:hypothetical protein
MNEDNERMISKKEGVPGLNNRGQAENGQKFVKSLKFY